MKLVWIDVVVDEGFVVGSDDDCESVRFELTNGLNASRAVITDRQSGGQFEKHSRPAELADLYVTTQRTESIGRIV